MMDKQVLLIEFKNSEFFKQYENTYFANVIIKWIFGEDVIVPKFYGKSYEYVYNNNIKVLGDFINGYLNQAKNIDEKTKKAMLCKLCIDPDGYSSEIKGGVVCSADGLISINRLFSRYGFSEKFIEEYSKYREFPILHFPKERGGINPSRAGAFGERIDHLLYDLKNYCEGKECRLVKAYEGEATAKWLESFGKKEKRFQNIVKWLDILCIFVDCEFNVYDLEKNDGSTINGYNNKYSREWSEEYYSNITEKIDKYNKRMHNKT